MLHTVILVLSRNTVTSLADHGTVPHHPLDCFYSNTFVQIEDTKIKTERGCLNATHRTNESLASQQSRSALRGLSRPDFLLRGFLTPLSLKDVQFSFLFFVLCYPIILNGRLCRIYLFILCCTFHCVNSKMLNEFSVLTKLIK